jgi:hypothetical protein
LSDDDEVIFDREPRVRLGASIPLGQPLKVILAAVPKGHRHLPFRHFPPSLLRTLDFAMKKLRSKISQQIYGRSIA